MSVNPYEPPQTDLTPAVEINEPLSYRREKFQVLLWILAMFAASGLIEGIATPTPEVSMVINLLVTLGFSIMILRWCHYDRLELDQRRWRFFAPMMVAFPGPLIMVPIYLLRSRGLAGVLSVVKALLFFLLLIAATALGVIFALAGRGEL